MRIAEERYKADDSEELKKNVNKPSLLLPQHLAHRLQSLSAILLAVRLIRLFPPFVSTNEVHWLFIMLLL